MSHQRILGFRQDTHQCWRIERCQRTADRQAADQVRDQAELEDIIGGYFGQQFRCVRFFFVTSFLAKTDCAIAQTFANDVVNADERTATNKQDVSCVYLDVLLFRMFPSTLWWYIRNSAFEHLQE